MLTIRPNFRDAMPGATACASAMGVSMLASSPASSFSRVIASNGVGGGPPLLLTRMSGAGQAASRASRTAGSPTSPATTRTCAPVAARISLAVASARASSRPLTITWQPACASARAQALPSPFDEAQTMAERPAMPKSMRDPRVATNASVTWTNGTRKARLARGLDQRLERRQHQFAVGRQLLGGAVGGLMCDAPGRPPTAGRWRRVWRRRRAAPLDDRRAGATGRTAALSAAAAGACAGSSAKPSAGAAALRRP